MNESSFDGILRNLATSTDLLCVSITMPILRGEFVGQQNPTRIKNLLASAETALVARGLRSATARDLMQVILAQTIEPGFWDRGGQGLAIFASLERVQLYRLPQPVVERLIVGRHYNITPLLPFETDGSYIVLELCKHDCRALRGHRFSLEELAVPGLPVSPARTPPEHDRHVSMHGAGLHGVQRQTVITGQGEPPERSKHEIEKHFRAVNAAMSKFLAGSSEPMVIVALPNLVPLYRQVNTYQHLEAGSIEGNPNSLSDHQLHRLSWQIVLPRFNVREQRVLARCVGEVNRNPSAITLPKIVLAAQAARVARLLVQADAVCWGTFDPATEQFRLTDPDATAAEDLLNLVAIETLCHGGEVFAADLSRSGIHELAAAEFKFDESLAAIAPALATQRH